MLHLLNMRVKYLFLITMQDKRCIYSCKQEKLSYAKRDNGSQHLSNIDVDEMIIYKSFFMIH